MVVLSCCLSGISDNKSFNALLADISKSIIRKAIETDARDNLSCIFICFDNLYKSYINKNESALRVSLNNLELKTDFEQLYSDVINKKFCDSYSSINQNNLNRTKSTEETKSKKGFFLRCCGIFN